MKLLIIGNAGHGKDAAAEILSRKYGLTHKSSSVAALEVFLFDVLNEKYKLGYATLEEAYLDRGNHRPVWFDEITAFNQDEPTRLARLIMEGTATTEENDIYVGMRNNYEAQACLAAGIFDYIIWIDATERLGATEPSTSFNISPEIAQFWVDNNGSLGDLEDGMDSVMGFIGVPAIA